MSVVSFPLAVVFIIRLFSTSAFRVPCFLKNEVSCTMVVCSRRVSKLLSFEKALRLLLYYVQADVCFAAPLLFLVHRARCQPRRSDRQSDEEGKCRPGRDGHKRSGAYSSHGAWVRQWLRAPPHQCSSYHSPSEMKAFVNSMTHTHCRAGTTVKIFVLVDLFSVFCVFLQTVVIPVLKMLFICLVHLFSTCVDQLNLKDILRRPVVLI